PRDTWIMFNAIRSRLRAYFVTVPPVGVDSVRDVLWSSDAQQDLAVLEQYKIYVEMADRISARRGLANTFFLSLNTGIGAIAATGWKDIASNLWVLLFLLIVLEIQCLAWFWLVRSYRQLNGAKYVVIGALEERLPASPYWKGEWEALGRGAQPERYWPLTHVEQTIPRLFAITYLTVFVFTVIAISS
uniref:RipA family octameric membrane protein n=1 Tax=Herbidospora mongoliensis TaxID=688067 RepID=UPI000A67BD48